MRFHIGRLRVLFLVAGMLPSALPAEDAVTVAVASNFAKTAQTLSAAFTQATGIPVRLSYGSTGKLYAQIINGAPFDVFLAADSARPLLLEQSGLIIDGSRQTYATGSLVLWSRDEKLRGQDCRDVLERGAYHRLALANPATAPYGAAAREFLAGMELWEAASRRAVYGENISQTLQFVATGNATLGFIASSQAIDATLPKATCAWSVPISRHTPLRQQAVTLKRAGDNDRAVRFANFLNSPVAKDLIREHGYEVPD